MWYICKEIPRQNKFVSGKVTRGKCFSHMFKTVNRKLWLLNRTVCSIFCHCVVCLENFEADGDHIPRLLRCTHTLCETCVKQLIRNQKLQCPECRAKHDARNKEKSFPQNKYLLIQINRKPTETRELQSERREKELCEEHGKVVVLFCKETGCQKPICVLCFKKYHKRHDIIDVDV